MEPASPRQPRLDDTHTLPPATGDADAPAHTVTSPGSSGGAAAGGDPAHGSSANPGSRFPSGGSSGPASFDHGRFLPGTLLAERYRIVELLGKGGMGEVYRADDLKLSQTIALKFLTRGTGDAADLGRFHNEVRVARLVAHPNVCRVYDIGEIDGLPFISLEYVDGAPLTSLLTQIGRLSADKAVDIARQLCYGLHAIHEQGLLHRDLKPANVMIDGRGRVRITDFGLAGAAEDLMRSGERAGTPAYMAPEQIAGRGVSVRSDIYSLGLVLYELFTGRRVFEAATWGDYVRAHQSEPPRPPSLHVTDLDPAVERIILRCLEKDPQRRPASAMEVAMALPGGDPLRAALAAGETPDPALVAAAGGAGALNPRVAVVCLALVLAGIALCTYINPFVSLVWRVPLPRPPAALVDRGREMLARFGYQAPPVDTAHGFAAASGYIEYVGSREGRPPWDELRTGRPPAILFWYRESQSPLVTAESSGMVSPQNPPTTDPGMITLWLDPAGALLGLTAFPTPRPDSTPGSSSSASQPEIDWSPLLSAAQLDETELEPALPRETPPVYCDVRAAWQGRYPGKPDIPVLIEAGAFDGRPVYFRMITPWPESAAARSGPADRSSLKQFLRDALAVISVIGGLLLAWRNVQLGRGDRRGALRMGVAVALLVELRWLLTADHDWTSHAEWRLLTTGAGNALLIGGWTWLLYMALEPYVRRLWPDAIISWSRLLSGRLRDPLVGRDILYGGLLGVGSQLAVAGMYLATNLTGGPARQPLPSDLGMLLGSSNAVAVVLSGLIDSCLLPMLAVLTMLLFRVVLRTTWLGAVALVVIYSAMMVFGMHHLRGWGVALDLLANVVLNVAWVLALVRYGLLVQISGAFFLLTLNRSAVGLDLSAWHEGSAWVILIATVGLAVYAFQVSLGGRSIWDDGFAGRGLRDARSSTERL